jgi:hypothetical protein
VTARGAKAEFDAETRVRRHPDAAHRVIDGQAVVVMPRDALLLTLNEVGSHIWQLLGDRTVADLARAVAEEFDVTYEAALADTLRFLEDLRSRGMVEVER